MDRVKPSRKSKIHGQRRKGINHSHTTFLLEPIHRLVAGSPNSLTSGKDTVGVISCTPSIQFYKGLIFCRIFCYDGFTDPLGWNLEW